MLPQQTNLKDKQYYYFEYSQEFSFTLQYSSIPASPKTGDLVCAFTTRALGNMSLVYGDTFNSLNNRKGFLKVLGINYQDLVCAQQVHGSKASYIEDKDKGKGALSDESAFSNTDALITDKKNLPLAIFAADCLSIFLYDPATFSIGLVHAGWRSTKENITTKTIQLMQEKFQTKTESLSVGFGPAIRACCYEVGKELKEYFSDCLSERNGRYYLDLVNANKKQILDLGVKEANILDSGICTSCKNEEFFSYRKARDSCGRLMSVIMLR